ncbi:transposase domain-containing protein [Herbiconiux sp. CPCC 205763]|uniref:Transposase domain-containing protein n=1 Tax=Herbiconiux aconitum TaxID=2970913 RepID=A0ABT2GW22_9MICO|nr:transposase domain-containing protein [Herbiconiux aconitum]MCS5719777.1 transposase domain-containing protein [Herbiconiux aconitum]
MPRSGWIKPDVDHRLSDHLAFAMLTRVYPPDVVDEVIAEVGRLQRRTRMLPSRIVVYYVLGLALFSNSSYDEVIRLLIAGQSWSSGWSQSWPVPTKAALYKARLRLGPEPLHLLFDRVAQPIATPGSDAGSYRGRRLLGMDVISLAIPGTPANEAEFAGPIPQTDADPTAAAADTATTATATATATTRAAATSTGTATGTSPSRRLSVRVLGLTELGTGAVIGASIGGAHDELSASAADLLPALGPGQLLLGAPELYDPQLWARAAATGADLLWELPPEVAFAVDSRHADGSFSARIATSPDGPPQSSDSHPVRIVEHPVSAGGRAVSAIGDSHRRYATTLHDPDADPAVDLVGLLSRRRSLASAFDEFRAHRNSPQVVLRSKIPAGVRQEIYGYLCVHYAMRWIMNAPDTHALDVEFTH